MSIKYLLLLSCCFALSSWANQVENRLGSVSIFDKKINTLEKVNFVGLSIWKSPIIPVKENISYTGTTAILKLLQRTVLSFSSKL